MADPELSARLDALEAQIAKLHETLSAKTAQPVQITAEDMQAFHKVRNALANPAADFGDQCGINECFRPPVIRNCVTSCLSCIQVCIFECTCGPCSMFNPATISGLSRFSQFG